jgi:glycosyltransferase involved in cell wall biosynthesis
MKLLQVIASMDPATGGPCRAIRNLVPALRTMGCESEVVCLDESVFVEDPFPVHAIGTGRPPWSYHSRLEPWLMENLSRFDAAILHGLWLYPGLALRRAARQSKRPYFIYPHGMLDPWFQRDASRRLKALRNWLYWQLVEHGVVRDAVGLLFTCEVEKYLARQTFRPYRPKMELSVGFGIPEAPIETEAMRTAFRKRCPDLAADRSYLLFLSRIDPKKGVDLLIQAYANVFVKNRTKVSDALPQLVIAGPGADTAYGQKVQTLAADLCPPNSVFWPGMLQGDAKWGAVHGCEAFVLPSHQENFGIAVAESLVCGIPVLISDRINIWREIHESHAGYVEPDTLAGTEALLRRWFQSDRKHKRDMQINARRCFLKEFEIGKAAESLIQTLERLLPCPA